MARRHRTQTRRPIRSPDSSWNLEYPETQAGQVEKITQGKTAADFGEWVAQGDLMRGMEELMGCKKMNAVEFQATVHNGVITLPDNQQFWNGKKIKVILLDEAGADAAELSANASTSEADFLAMRGFGEAGLSIKNPYALRHGRIIADATLRYQWVLINKRH